MVMVFVYVPDVVFVFLIQYVPEVCPLLNDSTAQNDFYAFEFLDPC